MEAVSLKEIELSTDKPPKIVESKWNRDWFVRATKKDVSGMRKNGWNIPEEFGDIYEAIFTYGYTFERIYTDKDGFLNLTTNEGN